MTIATQTNKVIALGDGSTTLFTYGFVAVDPGDIEVLYTDAAGNITTLTSVQYTLVINPAPVGQLWGIGGTVTYPLTGSPIAAGTTLTIARILPLVQPTALSNQGAFLTSAVEREFDLLEMQIQQLNETLGRAILAPIVDLGPLANLPTAVQRANQMLGFDSGGNPIAAQPASALVSTAMAPVVDAASLIFGQALFLEGLVVLPSRNAILTATLGPNAKMVYVQGYAAAGDLGQAFYRIVAVMPTHLVRVQSLDGIWCEIVPDAGRVRLRQAGGVGDGVTDDSTAANALGTAGNVLGCRCYVDNGTFLVSRQGTAFASVDYAISLAGNSQYWEGGGSNSIIKLNLHQNPTDPVVFTAVFNLQTMTGIAVFRNFQIACAPRVDIIHHGPMGITIGQMGRTASSPGALTTYVVEDMTFTNIAICSHGMGAIQTVIQRNLFNQQSGGLERFDDGHIVNHGSKWDGPRVHMISIADNQMNQDTDHGNHCIYLLGAMDLVSIQRNTGGLPSNGDWIKFLADPVGDVNPLHFWQADDSYLHIIKDNKFPGQSTGDVGPQTSGAILWSNSSTIENVVIQGNFIPPGWTRFGLMDWASSQLTVEGNIAVGCLLHAWSKPTNPDFVANQGPAYYGHNDFNGWNVGDVAGTLNVDGLSDGGSSNVTIDACSINPAGGAPHARYSIVTVNAVITRAVGNISTLTPAWVQLPATFGAAVDDQGNSWTWTTALTLQNSWTTAGDRTVQAWKEGRSVFVSGRLQTGTKTEDIIIAKLPLNFYPTDGVMHFCCAGFDGTNKLPVYVVIDTSGNLKLEGMSSAAGTYWVALDGISFDLP